MKKITLPILAIFSIAAVALLAGCYGQPAGQNAQPSQQSTENKTVTNTVTVKNFAFNPATLTVKKGATVTWTNEDSTPHQIVSDNGSFQGPSISNGQNYTFTFNETGGFLYHCGIHPSMKAKIIVE